MDLLKKELERKKKALIEARKVKESLATRSGEEDDDDNNDDNNNNDNDNKNVPFQQKRYLKASQLRQILDEQQEEALRERKRQRLLKPGNDVENYNNDSSLSSQQQHIHNNNQSDADPKGKKTGTDQSLKTQNHENQNQNDTDSQHQTGSSTTTRKVQFDTISTSSSRRLMESIPVVPTNSAIGTIQTNKILTSEEITKQLRQFGLPVRLFGEIDDHDHDNSNNNSTGTSRLGRLQVALSEQEESLEHISEQDEYRLGRGHGIRNPFLEKDKKEDDDITTNTAMIVSGTVGATVASPNNPAKTNVSTSSNNESKNNNNNKKKKKTNNREGTSNEVTTNDDNDDDNDNKKFDNNDDIKNDPHKRVYRYFKGLLKEWEADLLKRPEEVKRTVAGKNETKTVKQCKDYIRPLFKLCKHRTVEESMLQQLLKMVEFCEIGEFVQAHDAYMDVAIGRAAWPIGVTMVGIHARSGRAKIETSNVAHVMNSELQRKYLTSVKRLLTYVQKKRIDINPSKKVQN